MARPNGSVRRAACPFSDPKSIENGGHLLFVDFASVRPQLALDALADHGGFVGSLGHFFESRGNVAVGNAAGAEVAGNAVFSLFAGFGALASELFGITRVVDHAVFF